MKTLILVLTLLSSPFSQAVTPIESSKIQYAKFEQMNIGHDFLLSINEGSVLINETNGTVVLDLYQDLYCIPGEPCIQIMPNSYKVTLEITSVEFDSCGARIIYAVKDSSAVDGLYEEVQVTDHSTALCDYYVKHITHVAYRSTSPRSQVTQFSNFFANLLQDLPVPM